MELHPAPCGRPPRRFPGRAPQAPNHRPRGRRRACRRSLALAALWAVLALSPARQAVADEAKAVDPVLLDALRQIEVAFRTGEAQRLLPVLPPASKVLVGLDSFSSQPRDYYAADQVVLLFQQIFDDVRVLSFDLDRRGLGAGESQLLFVPARWSVRREATGLRNTRLQFTIRHEGDKYHIRGIKEVH